MDNVRGFGSDRLGFDEIDDTADDEAGDGTREGIAETALDVGSDERRMHVRAYNHWVSLLRGRAYPSIQDLEPGRIMDFGPHSVLLDFSAGVDNPAIAYLGQALRAECALDASITHVAQVPSRSLLSRLTDHYLQIIANRSPIGFEAEFVGTRGHNTLYRGILMPFSSEPFASDGDTIDFIYGVINWKELVDPAAQTRLDAEVAAAVQTAPKPLATAPAWADGPSARLEKDAPPADDPAAVSGICLADQLLLAQETAAAVHAADTRSRATLYRTLSRAHAFAAAADADPRGYAALLDSAAIAVQLRAPMTPVVKLVFGASYDKTRLIEYAAVLAHARRLGVESGELDAFLDGFEGGIKGVVRAERVARLPAPGDRPDPAAALADRPALARVTLDTAHAAGDYVVLLARADEGGTLDIVAAITDDAALTERAMRRATAG